jgi:hypothetical protein
MRRELRAAFLTVGFSCLAFTSFALTRVDAEYRYYPHVTPHLVVTVGSTFYIEQTDIDFLGAQGWSRIDTFKRNGNYISVLNSSDTTMPAVATTRILALGFEGYGSPLPPNLAGYYTRWSSLALQWQYCDGFQCYPQYGCNEYNSGEPCYDEVSGQVN